jgi:3-oxoacyl-(acyl-carrier-protein) synthase
MLLGSSRYTDGFCAIIFAHDYVPHPTCFVCQLPDIVLLLLLLLLRQSLDTEGYIAKKMERRLDKSIKFVLVSGKKALADAGLDWQGQDIKVGCCAAAAAVV